MIVTKNDIEKMIKEAAGQQETKIEIMPGIIRVTTQREVKELKKQEIKEILPLDMVVEWLTEQEERGIHEAEKVK